MTILFSSAYRRPRFAWLLWLALLLPLAQAAANWHAQSHWDAERSAPSPNKYLLPGDPCDLCLTAAALAGGGAASTPLAVAHFAPRHSTPVVRQDGVWSAGVSPVYESRAPPFVLR